jgi:predicted RNase H-like nuclease (RuvC/YqgF family)
VSRRPSALDAPVFGVDVQSGDVRGDAPSYALVRLENGTVERDVVSRRKLLRLIDDERPTRLATDNMYELAEDKSALIRLLGALPEETTLVQVTGDERPEPLTRVAARHGVPYGKEPMQEAEAAARLAARDVGQAVSAFTDTTRVKVARGRSVGKGGWSEDRHTRRIHGAVRKRAREIASTLNDAGLEYDRQATEKYGGLSNATFEVAAPPGAIPVSAERSGDVRVEIERDRRDGIEFQPLVERRDPVVVGVDPGTTTAAAVCGLDGEVLDVTSTRTADHGAIVEWLIERGRPVVVAADVTPMPRAVEKVRRSFEAAGWTPGTDLPVDEKLHRTRDAGYDNDHERDALAAALFACDDHADQFARIAQKTPPAVDTGDVVAEVVAEETSVEAAIAELTTDEADAAGESTGETEATRQARQRAETLAERVERLESYVEDLEATIEEKDARIDELEADLDAAHTAERAEAKARRSTNRLERENERLERELAGTREELASLENKLERLKALWKLDHSDFEAVADRAAEALVPVKPVEQFSLDAIEAAEAAYGLAPGDVVLLRDASGAGRRTAERLAEFEPRVVLLDGAGLSDVAEAILYEREVPFGPADAVETREVDELAVAREADVESVLEDWRERVRRYRHAENQQLVDRLISEHRAQRKDTTPSELLDS